MKSVLKDLPIVFVEASSENVWYKFEKELAKGLSSKVFLAIRKKDGEKFAIKRIERTFVNNKNYKKYINNEIYILKNINNDTL